MSFDHSKENVQPLRGGRNVAQLGVALQAETDMEHQRELMQQKGEFERLIRTYSGDDPLENWYNYTVWVEQSYPKQGHEGNLVLLLEQCLKLFEKDPRYKSDRRLCKLFIKYIDHQQHPLELYHMMYAQGLCRGCADLYKAWAYYFEAVGGFQDAHRVFECGKRELAQPYEELQIAHENLVMAAGNHILYGPNERALLEKRQALTSLQTYKPGQVDSVRNASIPIPGTFGAAASSRVNVPIQIHEDIGDEIRGAEAAPTSIITAAKRQDISKENTLKPGHWTTVPLKETRGVQKRTPTFTVHEDDFEAEKLACFVTATSENYSDWIVSLTIPEPKDDSKIPIYPKEKVYSEISTEYSLEEIRALRYVSNQKNVLGAASEVNQAVQSIIIEDNDDVKYSISEDQHEQMSYQNISLPHEQKQNNYSRMVCDHEQIEIKEECKREPPDANIWNLNCPQPCSSNKSPNEQLNPANFDIWSSFRNEPSPTPDVNLNSPQPCRSNKSPNEQLNPANFYIWNSFRNEPSPTPDLTLKSNVPKSPTPDVTLNSPQPCSSNKSPNEQLNPANFDLWSSFRNEPSPTPDVTPKSNVPKFSIYEQSNLEENIKPEAMKTPFKDLNAEELAETGSRGGMDVAAAAPVDSAKRLPLYDDDSSSSYEKVVEPVNFGDLSCNTQMFSFNLNVMQVSTPQNKQDYSARVDANSAKIAPKQLFGEDEKYNKILSPILEEETKCYGQSSSSGSSSATTKSSLSVSHVKTNNMVAISEEHNNYLTQNLMVNAALRSSSLGDLMDFGQHSGPPVSMSQKKPASASSSFNTVPEPTKATPLKFVPSDPFKLTLIEQLLKRIMFPGPHTQGYCCLNYIPKLVVRKESINLGTDKYVIEKQLGKGTYGTVFRGMDVRSGNTVAVKFQKPANKWEFYICRELQSRLMGHLLRERFMDVKIGYFSQQASVLISEFMPCGSLLDVANMVKQKSGRAMKESLCIHFCLEMLKVVQAMHQVKIIHADIKPDNFLVQLFPNDSIGLQLIDFGCSIDMSLFPPGASFTRRITTEDFVCCEMIDKRPWNYHTDMFCIAATAHVLLFEKYIQLQKKEGQWSISNRFPRYARVDLWNMFFSTLLNQQNGPADSAVLQAMLEDGLNHKFDDYHNELRYLTNILKNR